MIIYVPKEILVSPSGEIYLPVSFLKINKK